MPSMIELSDADVADVGHWRPTMCRVCRGARRYTGYKPGSTTEFATFECPCEEQLTLRRWFAVRGIPDAGMQLRWADMTGADPSWVANAKGFLDHLHGNLRVGQSMVFYGRSGSGKSSLMRAIAGLTPIQGGAVYASAKPALLGVGAVLLPNLSGEKNILLGGLAMGFGRKDMLDNTDAITKFAGLEEFIDLPMRTYSSGMSARLRFAIAASRDHDILIIDEALAVGDQEFRNRSEARMREMRDSAGTVFLVSHSMKSILDTCNRAVWLDKGTVRMDGDALEVCRAYSEAVGAPLND